MVGINLGLWNLSWKQLKGIFILAHSFRDVGLSGMVQWRKEAPSTQPDSSKADKATTGKNSQYSHNIRAANQVLPTTLHQRPVILCICQGMNSFLEQRLLSLAASRQCLTKHISMHAL